MHDPYWPFMQIEAVRKEVAETEAELQRATRLPKLADPEGYSKVLWHVMSAAQACSLCRSRR